MNGLDREAVKKRFAEYTDNYNSSDPKIKLKIDHTYRVADLCERIAVTVPDVSDVSGAPTTPGTPTTDRDLAWLSGMLHDIGRFEQVRRYNTFSDAQSVDHAAFGADLLFKEGLLEMFGDYDSDVRNILETAIRNHNRFKVEEGLSDEYLTYCNILRDADKIDILRVNIDTPLEEIYNVTSEDLKNAGVTDAVKQGFLEERAILRSERKTSADVFVSHISMIHELVYPISVEIVRKQGYLEKLLEFRSENEETNKWFDVMRNTLRDKGLIDR